MHKKSLKHNIDVCWTGRGVSDATQGDRKTAAHFVPRNCCKFIKSALANTPRACVGIPSIIWFRVVSWVSKHELFGHEDVSICLQTTHHISDCLLMAMIGTGRLVGKTTNPSKNLHIQRFPRPTPLCRRDGQTFVKFACLFPARCLPKCDRNAYTKSYLHSTSYSRQPTMAAINNPNNPTLPLLFINCSTIHTSFRQLFSHI